MADEKLTCQFCGKEFSKAGIANHEKSCKLNPANAVPVEEAPVVGEVPVINVAPKAKLVTIKVNRKFECYIGDRYWRFAHGEVAEVPEHVREKLLRAGLLEMI